jgi:4-hydroxybenzoate polyprenyltransferase
MVKDLEDAEGDQQLLSSTLPLVLGKQKSKLVIGGVWLVFVGMLGYLLGLLWQASSIVLGLYLTFAVLLPLMGGGIYLFWTRDKYQYRLLSYLLKGVMITGVLSMLVFRWIFQN